MLWHVDMSILLPVLAAKKLDKLITCRSASTTKLASARVKSQGY